MPDELAPGSPDTPSSTQSTDTHEIPWQKRYEDLRPEFDRTTSALKQEQGVWEDEQAALARLAEKFPHLFEDESDDTEDDTDFEDDAPDPNAAEIAELKAWKAQVEAERGETRFNKDLSTELGDREVTDRQRSWIKDRTVSLGNDPKALKQAVEEWAEITGELVAKPKPRPRATHVIPGGQPATNQKPWSEMTRAEAEAAQLERAQALSQN